MSAVLSDGTTAAIAGYRASLRRRRILLALLAVIAVAAFLVDIAVGPSLLSAGDALKLRDESKIALTQADAAEVLLFDLPY